MCDKCCSNNIEVLDQSVETFSAYNGGWVIVEEMKFKCLKCGCIFSESCELDSESY